MEFGGPSNNIAANHLYIVRAIMRICSHIIIVFDKSQGVGPLDGVLRGHRCLGLDVEMDVGGGDISQEILDVLPALAGAVNP